MMLCLHDHFCFIGTQPLADSNGRSPENTQEGGMPFQVVVATISTGTSNGLQYTSEMVFDGCSSGYLDPAMYGVHPLQ